MKTRDLIKWDKTIPKLALKYGPRAMLSIKSAIRFVHAAGSLVFLVRANGRFLEVVPLHFGIWKGQPMLVIDVVRQKILVDDLNVFHARPTGSKAYLELTSVIERAQAA